MRFKLISGWVVGSILAMVVIGGAPAGRSAETTGSKFEVQLLWATDDNTSSKPKHKPVGPDLKKRLNQLPLKWTNYFEETRKVVLVRQHGAEKTNLSGSCDIEIRDLGGSRVEVTHFGKGKKVGERAQDLPRGDILVLGGNAPGATSWLVVVKRID